MDLYGKPKVSPFGMGKLLDNLVGVFDIQGAIDDLVSDLVYGIKGITGGLIDLTDLLHETREIASTTRTEQVNQGVIIGGMQVTKADTIRVPTNIPLWDSINVVEDSTFPQILQDATKFFMPGHGVTVFGFIRVPYDRTYDTVGIVTGPVLSPCSLDVSVWRLESDGTLERVALIRNADEYITTGRAHSTLNLPTTLTVTGGDFMAVGVRQYGAGNMRELGGLTVQEVPRPSATYPREIGATTGETTPTVTAGQTNFADNKIPWFCLGSEVNPGNPIPLTFVDEFVGPDFSDLSSNWAVYGGIELYHNEARTKFGPDNNSIQSGALWVEPLNFDDMEVGCQVGEYVGSAEPSWIVVRSDSQFTSGLCVQFNKNNGFGLGKITGLNETELVSGGSGAVTSSVKPAVGDNIRLTAIGDHYRVYRNDALIIHWEDTTGQFATGRKNRFVGFYVYFRELFGDHPSAHLERWWAFDIPNNGASLYPTTAQYPATGLYPLA